MNTCECLWSYPLETVKVMLVEIVTRKSFECMLP